MQSIKTADDYFKAIYELQMIRFFPGATFSDINNSGQDIRESAEHLIENIADARVNNYLDISDEELDKLVENLITIVVKLLGSFYE